MLQQFNDTIAATVSLLTFQGVTPIGNARRHFR